MSTFKVICLLILLALVAVFTFQNIEAIEVNFLTWSIAVSVSLLLLSALFAGIIIGLFLSFLNVRMKSKKKRAEDEI